MSEPSDGRATHLASSWTIWRAFLGVILAFVVLLLVLLPPPIVPPQVVAFWPALFLFVVLLNLLGLLRSGRAPPPGRNTHLIDS